MRISTTILLTVCSLTLLLTACTGRGFPVKTIDSFTLAADPAMMEPVQGSGESAALLQQLLTEASNLDTPPALPQQIAQFTVRDAKGDSTYAILQDGDNYYAREGERLRVIDAATLREILASYGAENYVYGALPTAEITVSGVVSDLAVRESSYYFRGVDGSQHPVPATTAEPEPYTIEPGAAFTVMVSQSAETGATILDSEGTAVWQGELSGLSGFAPERSGEYRLQVTAEFTSPHHYFGGNMLWEALLHYEIPLHFSVTGADTFPGELVILRAHNLPEGATVEFRSATLVPPKFFPDGEGSVIALLPIGTNTAVGQQSFTLRSGDYAEEYTVTAKDKQFQIQNMTIDNETAQETVYSQQANQEFSNVIAPLRPVADPQQHWEGGFRWPVEQYRVTTEFGMIRYVNGAPTASRHNAIDMAAPTGTPVYATNRGRVLYAGFLQLTGNTVIIEHGYGLKSWYYHMDSLSMQTEDMVENGQQIGTVGSTGFSTGPHLHFGISVNHVYSNPTTIIEGGLLSDLQ